MATSTSATSTGTVMHGTGATTGSTTTSMTTTRPLAPETLFISLSLCAGEFYFFCIALLIWPLHPPNIFPTSSILIDKSIYFFSSSDLISHKILSITFTVSIFRIANLTHGNFSSFCKKVAIETASTASTNKESIFTPNECRCIFGKIR